MNWIAFAGVFGAIITVGVVVLVGAGVATWLDRRFGSYAGALCVIVMVALIGSLFISWIERN